MAAKTEDILAAKNDASCSTGQIQLTPDQRNGDDRSVFSSQPQEGLQANDAGIPQSGCQAANDEVFEDLSTQDHNEAMSELEAVGKYELGLPLHQRNGCYKKDRHGEFIPIREFSIDNLDPPYKDQEIVDVVKLMAGLTVRLLVRQISPSRPLYPAYPPKKRVDKYGIPCLMHGSGFVQTVFVFREGCGKPCPCSKCKESASPRTSWGQVLISTAGHVIFDSFEAEGTTCYFDFDEDDTDIVCIPSLTGGSVSAKFSDEKFDMIFLFFYTHDVEFAEKLGTMSCEYWLDRSKLLRKYYGSSDTQAVDVNYYREIFGCIYSFISKLEHTEENRVYVDHMVDAINTLMPHPNIPKGISPIEIAHQYLDPLIGVLNTLVQQDCPTLPSNLQPKGNLVIVVSHPHGCGKYVSLGEYTSRQQITHDFDIPEFFKDNPPVFYEYTAQTCPGSSGGPVFILSKENVGILATHVHSEFLAGCDVSRCSSWIC